ncbi:MAG: hypothetical protein A2622_11585 [Bdellovibrionales bacterium RIFCSPHIGHO2_01_FULL_40_29]|nr:MAG: hypothetical protein A2622_11585 [Bdellovibrionales bacterium RIFCSPHIGHO2_01_FULL_40_29]OFZ34587.1 MAG: hypothetical protein A3D17_01850 [Bdellovibrionales bacterium RIFCSPHIGHO2_02_FULL_40_15]
MKIYRSIEFSKLIFLLKEEGQFVWDEYQAEREKINDEKLHHNWWMNSNFDKKRREIIASIIKESSDSFFKKSLEFNAMSGGRFNPERSFGVLYAANNPVISALEVLYHKYIDLAPVYAAIQSKQSQFSSGLDMSLPKNLEVFIVTFEIEIENSDKLLKINESDAELRNICNKIGFQRYTITNFNREFIFGNDYEISRHLGTYVHSQNKIGFTVPSARVKFEIQDDLSLRNLILLEAKRDATNPKLTGKFVEYRASIDMTQTDHYGLDVAVQAYGETVHKTMFKLQKIPPKKAPHPQIISYFAEYPNGKK